jgi:glycerophosphodiester phosphodiesterase
MKFAQNLPHNQVPEWASSYIDYKALKKLIKTAKNETRAGEDADLASTVRRVSLLVRKT